MISKLSLFGIYLYQTYISPKKGFSCAYRVAHGGTGCSGYAKERIKTVGLFSAIPEIKQRFKSCSQAADEINEERRKRRENKTQKDKKCNTCNTCSDCSPVGFECMTVPRGCFAFSDDVPKMGGSASKCDGCDIGDCGGCDVGGCG